MEECVWYRDAHEMEAEVERQETLYVTWRWIKEESSRSG